MKGGFRLNNFLDDFTTPFSQCPETVCVVKKKICSFPSVSPGPDTQLYCSLLCGVGLRTSVRFFDYSRHKDAYKVCVVGGGVYATGFRAY